MNIKKLKDIKVKAERLGEWESLDLDTKSISEDMTWLVKTIENQQAEIDSLSMAHDAVHRDLPKDKHTLIKSNIDKERTITSLRERVQELSAVISCVASREVEIVEQNKRYQEVIEEIKKTSDDYRAGHFLDIQDSFFVDEIIAIINKLEGLE